MADADLIAAYLDSLRHSLRRRSDLDDLVSEIDDHLRCAASVLQARGLDPVAAQSEVLTRFGDAVLVADSFSSTTAGGSAMPTRLTRTAGAFAIAAAVTWLAVAPAAVVGAGADNWEPHYLRLALLVFVAAACTTIALFGLLRRVGSKGWVPALAMTLAVLGTLTLGVVTWAWIVGVGLLTIAALLTVHRLRAARLGSTIAGSLLVLAWPTGVAMAIVLDLMKVGPLDGYGEPYLGQLIGFAAGAVIFAAGLMLAGRWLRGETAADTSDSMATA